MTEKQTISDPLVLKELPARRNTALLVALELLIGPDVQTRKEGLSQLITLDGHRRSPLAAAVLASRVDEPDRQLRVMIVDAVASMLTLGEGRERPSNRVRQWTRSTLFRMRKRDILALLQIIAESTEHIETVCCVLNACSYAGEQLIQILLDPQANITLRIAAAEAIACVGFLDARPYLQALEQRIAGRTADQMRMEFAPEVNSEVDQLLPSIRKALIALLGETD